MKQSPSHRFSLLSLFLILTLSNQSILAQDAQGQPDWAAVQAVPAGQKLAIESKSGERIEGKLSSISDASLTLVSQNKTVSVNKTDVRRVYRLSGGSRLKTALIGAGIGAGVGVGVGFGLLAATGGSDESADIVAGCVLVVAGIGGALGALAGKGSKHTLIYDLR